MSCHVINTLVMRNNQPITLAKYLLHDLYSNTASSVDNDGLFTVPNGIGYIHSYSTDTLLVDDVPLLHLKAKYRTKSYLTIKQGPVTCLLCNNQYAIVVKGYIQTNKQLMLYNSVCIPINYNGCFNYQTHKGCVIAEHVIEVAPHILTIT